MKVRVCYTVDVVQECIDGIVNKRHLENPSANEIRRALRSEMEQHGTSVLDDLPSEEAQKNE